MATESKVRYSYSEILAQAFGTAETPADKIVARKFGVSERQIRKARMGDGTVDAFLADAMVTGLGLHPNFIFGFEGWIEVDPDVLEAEAVASEARAAVKARRAS